MSTMFDVKRLEQLLSYWEDNVFFLMLAGNLAFGKHYSRQKIFSISRDFRQHLLRASSESYDNSFDEVYCDLEANAALSTSSRLMHAWSGRSRNVFQIKDDLRVLLQATRFNKEKWSSIPWPFKSFAVALETPVIVEGTMIDYVIMASGMNLDRESMIQFLFLPVSFDRYKSLHQKDREYLIKLIEKEKFHQFSKKFSAFARQIDFLKTFPLTLTINIGNGIDLPLTENPLDHLRKTNIVVAESIKAESAMIELARMIAAMALYLTTLPAQTKPSSPPHDATNICTPKSGNDKLIRLPSNIFRLTSLHTLSPQEKEQMEDAMAKELTGAVVPHWRRGYFKRPLGQGQNPEAERTLWIRPTLVNRQHLPEGTLPGGALVTVKSD